MAADLSFTVDVITAAGFTVVSALNAGWVHRGYRRCMAALCKGEDPEVIGNEIADLALSALLAVSSGVVTGCIIATNLAGHRWLQAALLTFVFLCIAAFSVQPVRRLLRQDAARAPGAR